MPAVQPAAPAALHAVHDAREPATDGLVNVQAAQTTVLKVPVVPQVAVPLPLYPELHVTAMVSPVLPVRNNGKDRIEIKIYER